MTHLIAPMTLSDLEGHALIAGFLDAIFRTVVHI